MTKLEEIARAIEEGQHLCVTEGARNGVRGFYVRHRKGGETFKPVHGPCATELEAYRALYLERAHMVVEAMREPSEAMLEAADKSDALDWSLEPGEGLDGVAWRSAWEDMLDAILDEAPETEKDAETPNESGPEGIGERK